jgi:hypothetical protein
MTNGLKHLDETLNNLHGNILHNAERFIRNGFVSRNRTPNGLYGTVLSGNRTLNGLHEAILRYSVLFGSVNTLTQIVYCIVLFNFATRGACVFTNILIFILHAHFSFIIPARQGMLTPPRRLISPLIYPCLPRSQICIFFPGLMRSMTDRYVRVCNFIERKSVTMTILFFYLITGKTT